MKIEKWSDEDVKKLPVKMQNNMQAIGIVACLLPNVKTGHLFTCSRKERRAAYQNPRQFFFASLNHDVAIHGMQLMGFGTSQYYLANATLEHVKIKSEEKDFNVLMKRGKK